ncbi:restriction endonuclease subunit S [Maribacter dokdonensis]|uniref:restriction endonuclease subunit S n=1 Tax=Maribacter dokdonensis TaxID=320912 RepID=UPI0007199523|nr:restriction endonuclease subunit S [Maribacter dokdonensis]KSA14196.1 Type I restriction-modification system, specificity subunit S [Maribacter dokdonensis DSW-8]
MINETIENLNIVIIDGDRGSNYPSEGNLFSKGFCLFLNAKNVTKNGLKFETTQFIDKKRDKLLRNGKLVKNDFILTTRGTIGNFGFFNDSVNFEHIRINSGMVILRNNNKRISNEFLYYAFRSQSICKQIEIISSGSAQPQLTVKTISNLVISFPDNLPQQKKIAKILSTVDTVIEKTESAIAKYQAIKQGLMHDLFTRGIDVNTGKLRPKSQDEPELYKESALGLIPREWEVEQLNEMVSDVLDFKASGSFETLTANVKYYYEFKYARLIRLTDLRHNLSKDGVYLDKKGFNFLKKSKLIEGDILIACVGEYTGYVCRMPRVNYPAIIAPNMFLIRFDKKYNSFFINYFMNTDTFQRQIAAVSTSSATKLLNNPNLRSLKLAFPERKEQNLIAEKLESVNTKIQTEQQVLAKYQQLKAGLLQDLLTGKVAVSVD